MSNFGCQTCQINFLQPKLKTSISKFYKRTMEKTQKFGTPAVFFTAVSTILGAILFLRFGYAVGTVGLWGTFLLIIIGHMVTIPTALAISELATNKRVEGGGEYFIISRSFGLNIGATLGLALYLSQTISVAFYIIAFTEAFSSVFDYVSTAWGIHLARQIISIPAMLLLSSKKVPTWDLRHYISLSPFYLFHYSCFLSATLSTVPQPMQISFQMHPSPIPAVYLWFLPSYSQLLQE